MMARILIAVVALCAACGAIRGVLGVAGKVTEKPGLSQAVAVVWASYGRDDGPPAVRIVEGAELTCIDTNSGEPGFPVLLASGWACRNGYTVSPLQVSVSWTGWSWSQTTLAHELQHAAQARRGIVDPYHARDEWKTAVPAANELLRSRGL